MRSNKYRSAELVCLFDRVVVSCAWGAGGHCASWALAGTPPPKLPFADPPQTYRAQYFEIDQPASIADAAHAICGI
jgi:hypothetical protein